MKKLEFAKRVIIVDYAVFGLLLVLTVLLPGIDFITLDVAWIAQLAVSTGFYFWKAKSENRTKVPINVIKTLPRSMRKDLDITQVILAIIQAS